MNYRASLTIPANTPATSPVEQEVQLGHGMLTTTRIRLPAGHAGLAHLRIYRWEHQLYPTSADRDYAGDDEVIEIEDQVPIDEPPYTLTLWGYNTDDTYAHTFEVSFTLRPEAGLGLVPLAVSRVLAELQE